VSGTLSQPGIEVEVLLSNEGPLARALRALGPPVTVIDEARSSRLRHAREVVRWIGERRFDVVHVHRYKEIALSLGVPPRRRGGLVVTVHGLEPRDQMSLRSAVSIWGILLAARWRGARFAAVSEELRERLARVVGSSRVERIPNPVPPPTGQAVPDLRAELGWSPDRPLVAFAGRLEEVKGPDRLLDAAAVDGSPLGFVLLGGGSLDAELRRRVEDEGLSDRVALLGPVPDASAYLPQFQVLALPSRHEGMPMVLLEAAAHSLPVVAFDVGGVAEVLDGGAATRLVPDGDIAAFRRALDETAGRSERVESDLAAWSASIQRRYGVEATAAAYAALYRRIAEDPARVC
jgi:glycosyltransferase involved in cell wall biosynthesis